MSGDVASSQSQQKNIRVVPSVGGLRELVYELFDPPTYLEYCSDDLFNTFPGLSRIADAIKELKASQNGSC
jgi:hypothetical protein